MDRGILENRLAADEFRIMRLAVFSNRNLDHCRASNATGLGNGWINQRASPETCNGSSCDCSIAAADGAEDAVGRARLDKGAAAFPLSATNAGATSGATCAEFCFTILEVPVLPKVATEADFSAATGFSACVEFSLQLFSLTVSPLPALSPKASQSYSEAAEAGVFELDEAG